MLWSRLHNSLFIALSRPLFLLGLCSITLNLWLDKGKAFKKFLSLRFFLVLGRLSYAVYLVLPLCVSLLVSSITQSLYLSYNAMFYLLFYNLVASFLAGFIIHFLFERPVK